MTANVACEWVPRFIGHHIWVRPEGIGMHDRGYTYPDTP